MAGFDDRRPPAETRQIAGSVETAAELQSPARRIFGRRTETSRGGRRQSPLLRLDDRGRVPGSGDRILGLPWSASHPARFRDRE